MGEVGVVGHEFRRQLGLLIEGFRRAAGGITQAFDPQFVGFIARPIQHHIANVELVGLGGRLNVVRTAVRGLGVYADGKCSVFVEYEVVARENINRVHVLVPKREIVLGHAVLAHAPVNSVFLVPRDGNDSVDRIRVVDAPT